MRQAALIICVLASLAQSGDGFRVSAGICENARCTALTHVQLEPVTIAVYVYVPVKAGEQMAYGLVCDGVDVASTDVDLKNDPAPLYTRSYRNVGAGECVAVAVIVRADGSRRSAWSQRLIVTSRG